MHYKQYEVTTNFLNFPKGTKSKRHLYSQEIVFELEDVVLAISAKGRSLEKLIQSGYIKECTEKRWSDNELTEFAKYLINKNKEISPIDEEKVWTMAQVSVEDFINTKKIRSSL